MTSDWSFARRPFWLFSHIFAATVVVTFVLLGWWQLSRHYERTDFNDEVRARSLPPAMTIDEALLLPADEVDLRLVTLTATYVDGDVIRVANRSQGGVAGQHVVALAQLDDGRQLLVNRGFVPLGSDVALEAVASGPVEITGWLRLSVEKGWFGATDSGQGPTPRLDVEAIANRLGGDQSVVPHWLLLDNGTDTGAPSSLASFPDPVPLPSLDAGPHLSYMGQWFIFAVLGIGFYGALLRRNARGKARAQAQPELLDD